MELPDVSDGTVLRADDVERWRVESYPRPQNAAGWYRMFRDMETCMALASRRATQYGLWELSTKFNDMLVYLRNFDGIPLSWDEEDKLGSYAPREDGSDEPT